MRTKTAMYNLSFSLLLQIVILIMGFVKPKLFITGYGTILYGLIASLSQFLIYLSLVEAGVGAASIQALYKPIAEKNKEKINSILSATRIFYMRSGMLLVILIVILAFSYQLIIDEDISKSLIFMMALVMGSSSVIDFLLTGKYVVLLTADQKNYIISVTQMIATILNMTVSIILILSNQNILLVLFIASIISFLRYIILSYYVKRNYKGINFYSKPDMTAINKRWDAFIHQMSNLVVYNTPIIIITIFCSLIDVSIYAIYSIVFASITNLVMAFSNGMFAGFGEIMARNEKKSLQKAYNLYEYFYYMIIFIIYTCTAVLIIPFVGLYTVGITDANFIDPLLAFLFILVGIFNNVRVPQMTMVVSAGHFRETISRTILESTINLTVSLIMVQIYGLYGVLIGSICAYLYRTTDFIFYANQKILQLPVWRTLKHLLVNTLGSIFIIIIFYQLNIEINTWLMWFIWGCILFSTSILVIFAANFICEPKSMTELLNRARKLVKSLVTIK